MLQFLFKNSKEVKVVEDLLEESRVDFGFVLNLLIASLIITIGLVTGQLTVVIGGMLIAPVLYPILALGLALSTLSFKGVKRSIEGIFISSAISISSAYFIANLLEGAEFRGQEILISLSPSFLSFLVAFLSGIAASYGWIKRDHIVILPGVAIVVALVPPLCASGIALAVQNKALFHNFIALYFLNLFGIVLASFLVFVFSGFSKIKKVEEHMLEKEEKVE